MKSVKRNCKPGGRWMITISSSGSFSNIDRFFKKAISKSKYDFLHAYGKMGVNALKAGTPQDTGKTRDSWSYKIEKTRTGMMISWHNSNIEDGFKVAIVIQYGHATKNGSWVDGVEYINPAMQKTFNQMAANMWREVTGT